MILISACLQRESRAKWMLLNLSKSYQVIQQSNAEALLPAFIAHEIEIPILLSYFYTWIALYTNSTSKHLKIYVIRWCICDSELSYWCENLTYDKKVIKNWENKCAAVWCFIMVKPQQGRTGSKRY